MSDVQKQGEKNLLKITLQDGVYHLSGRMDEYAAFDGLLSVPEPLKLNLGAVSAINSMGVRKFLTFTLAYSPKTFEFYECTAEFVANVNVIPQMLGTSGDGRQIKSFYVPYSCEGCQKTQRILFERSQVGRGADGDVLLPDFKCSTCKEPLEVDVERAEFFAFLFDGEV